MAVDRYLKIILTIIAVELASLALRDGAPHVTAQAAPTPVVIQGIDITGETGYLPVAVVGGFRQIPASMQETLQPLAARIEAERPLRIEAVSPLRVDVMAPIRIVADRPLKVESVPYTPGLRPGD